MSCAKDLMSAKGGKDNANTGERGGGVKKIPRHEKLCLALPYLKTIVTDYDLARP